MEISPYGNFIAWLNSQGYQQKDFYQGGLFAANSNLLNLYLLLREWKSTPIAYCALQLLHADSCKARIFLCFQYAANLVTAASTT